MDSDKVIVRGTIDSAHYVDIRSAIQGTILKVASEGPVRKDDLVVELDKKAIEDQVKNQKIAIGRLEVELRQTQLFSKTKRDEWEARIAVAKGQLGLAKLALEKYVDSEHGEHKVALDALEREITVAKKQLSLAQKQVARLKELAGKEPYALEQAELEVLQASAVLHTAEASRKKLQTYDYEFRKRELELAVLRSQLEQARASSAREAALAEQTAELNAMELARQNKREKLTRAQQQLMSCRINSPLVGFVTLAKQQVRRGPVVIKPGSRVRERQRLLRIHDLDSLQLKVFVPRKQGERIQVGAPAVVGIDAFPDRRISGQVSKVGPITESDRAFAGDTKEFSVVMSLKDLPQGVRPGLTAVAEIDVSKPR